MASAVMTLTECVFIAFKTTDQLKFVTFFSDSSTSVQRTSSIGGLAAAGLPSATET